MLDDTTAINALAPHAITARRSTARWFNGTLAIADLARSSDRNNDELEDDLLAWVSGHGGSYTKTHQSGSSMSVLLEIMMRRGTWDELLATANP